MKTLRTGLSKQSAKIAAVLCVSFLCDETQLRAAAELPVRTVVLYKHGVGYFERSGTLGPGESAKLDFKADEMNDVLKSLTVTDAGGDVRGLRYDSSVPLEEKLKEFPFRIEPGEPLSALIDQLKGARIETEFGPQKLAGSILSARLIAADKDHAEREQLTVLLDTGELRNLDLAAATSIRFTDPKIQAQFRDYLAVVTGARSKDHRSLYIDSTDSKARDVRASYIVPMPAWKSSYRLLLDAAGQQSTLEGWAVVDNTTGEDWTKVHVSLVSGKPISFISQLYVPKFIDRKQADLPEAQAAAPTVHSGAVRGGQFDQAALMQRPAAGFIGGALAAPKSAEMRTESAPSSLRDTAAAAEIADLFEYSIRQPLTVKKNESAMLPFLQQKIGVRKLLIYSDQTKANPLSAAEMTNTSGKTLDGGPITVYDGGSYAGEALVETIKAGDKRFISYGFDLGTRISTALDSRSDSVRELHIRNGVLLTRSALVEKKTYSIRNVDAKSKTLIVEHPVRREFVLTDTAKPLETSNEVYRFEIKIPAAGQVQFPVTEENVYETTTAVASLTPDAMLTYVRNKKLTDAARRQLQEIVDLKRKLVETDSEKARIDGEISAISADEQRLRENIRSLSAVSGQQQAVQDYARKLADQEVAITRNRDRQAQLDGQRASTQAQLNALIEKLDF